MWQKSQLCDHGRLQHWHLRYKKTPWQSESETCLSILPYNGRYTRKRKWLTIMQQPFTILSQTWQTLRWPLSTQQFQTITVTIGCRIPTQGPVKNIEHSIFQLSTFTRVVGFERKKWLLFLSEINKPNFKSRLQNLF